MVMTMGAERIREWAEILNKKTVDFQTDENVAAARDILVCCSCIEAAVTGFLMKHKMDPPSRKASEGKETCNDGK